MKFIPDTSVWVDHFRGLDTLLGSDPKLGSRQLLHPFVYGELLLGGLPRDNNVRRQLELLNRAPVAEPAEVAAFIEWAELAGTGIGYVDAHLLVSARMIDAKILTSDKRLLVQAKRFGIALVAG